MTDLQVFYIELFGSIDAIFFFFSIFSKKIVSLPK